MQYDNKIILIPPAFLLYDCCHSFYLYISIYKNIHIFVCVCIRINVRKYKIYIGLCPWFLAHSSRMFVISQVMKAPDHLLFQYLVFDPDSDIKLLNPSEFPP